jgi:anti-sigma factor RsiW
MNCPDLKAHLFGEEPGAAEHLKTCGSCQEEWARLQLTYAALRSLPDEEVPRRIAFVSDKVFEPKWWRRIPKLIPAAALLSAAIIFHALYVSGSVAAVEARLLQRDEETRAAVNASFEYLNKKLAAERSLNAGYIPSYKQ